MKHFLWALVLVFLAAAPAWSGPNFVPLNKPPSTTGGTVLFVIGDTSDSPAIGVSGYCTVRYQQSSGDDAALYAVTSSTSSTSSGTLLTTFSSSTSPTNPAYTFTASTQWVKAKATDATAGGSVMIIECNPTFGSSGGGTNSYSLSGAYMTPATMTYMSSMKSFEGLDPKIPWTRYWIDPYNGSDSNDGTYAEPFRTLGKWKTLAGFGTWFTIKNGGRDRPMYISNQTFPYPTGENCVVGEIVTSGAKTSKILDIDLAAGKVVFETTGGTTPLVATDAITTGSQSGTACSWTLGTRAPAIWDGTAALCALDNFDTCLVANRYTTTGCTGGGANICQAASEVEINLSATPTGYDGRIVSIIDAEDPSLPPIVHGDKETLGDLNNTEAGTNRDAGGLFITGDNGTTTSYGCLGVANIWADAVMDDIISQHSEGCVRALNVRADRVWNLSNAKNNNVITTHGGTAGRGGVVSINGSGIGYRYDDTGGPPIAPTGSAHMILIGTGAYASDMTNWPGATLSSVMTATGGSVSIVGHEVYCDGTGGATLGCTGLSAVAQDSIVNLDLIRVMARYAKNSAASAVGLTSNGYAINSKIYRGSFDGGRAIQTNASNGAISLDVKGAIFSALDYYVYDLSSYAGATTTTTGTVNGVYDNDGSNRWATDSGGTTFNTAALAEAGMETWDIMTGTYAVQTDATEYTSDFGMRCASTGECWDAYSESFAVDFPEVIYDYLPVPIRGYIESGTRNYGAR